MASSKFHFKTISTYLTETIANSKYLRLIGGILSGNLGIKRTPRAELDILGKAIINTNLNNNQTGYWEEYDSNGNMKSKEFYI